MSVAVSVRMEKQQLASSESALNPHLRFEWTTGDGHCLAFDIQGAQACLGHLGQGLC